MIRGLDTPHAEMVGMPKPAGPAWFPSQLVVADDASTFASAVHTSSDLHTTLLTTGWIARDALGDLPATCASARVLDINTNEVGQTAEIRYEAAGQCMLVVATNYTQILRASTNGRALRVVRIDIALTGIAVPVGTGMVELSPHVDTPTWTWFAELVGMLALITCCVLHLKRGTA